MKKVCIECGRPIPAKRLKALPKTTTCVKCSDEKAKMGVTIWNETTGQLAILNEEDVEELIRLEKGDGRLGRLK